MFIGYKRNQTENKFGYDVGYELTVKKSKRVSLWRLEPPVRNLSNEWFDFASVDYKMRECGTFMCVLLTHWMVLCMH